MRVFPDTNVLASALGSHGLCADLFEHLLEQHALVTSEAVLNELRNVLTRKFRLSRSLVREYESLLRSEAALVPPVSPPFGIRISDADDAPILAAAAAAGAELFITVDKAVLAVKRVARMRIVSPRDAWTVLFTPTTRK